MIEPVFKRDPRETTWIEQAACLEEDPELFFPVGYHEPAMEQASRGEGRVCSAVRSAATACAGPWTHARTPACGADWTRRSGASSAGSGDAWPPTAWVRRVIS